MVLELRPPQAASGSLGLARMFGLEKKEDLGSNLILETCLLNHISRKHWVSKTRHVGAGSRSWTI